MKTRYKVLISALLLVAATPVAFDVTHTVVDKIIYKSYIPCILKTHEHEWSSTCYDAALANRPVLTAVNSFMIEPGFGLFAPQFGLFFPLTGRCVKPDSRLKSGAKAVGRDYFGCNKAQIILSDILYGPNGERL